MDDIIKLSRGNFADWAKVIGQRQGVSAQIARLSMRGEIGAGIAGIVGAGLQTAGVGGPLNISVNLNGAMTVNGTSDVKRIARQITTEVVNDLRQAGVI